MLRLVRVRGEMQRNDQKQETLIEEKKLEVKFALSKGNSMHALMFAYVSSYVLKIFP